jgi:MFS family permease
VGDWSVLYMRDALRASPATAALGFAAFSLAMAVGRLTGDRIVGRFGAVGVLSPGAATAAGALGLALIAGQPAVGVLGFAAVGLGLANLIPVVFGAAGRLPEFPAGVGIAAVSTAGYCGFLAGPPLIGLVAEGAGLTTGLALVASTLAAIALGSDVLGKHLEEAVATA